MKKSLEYGKAREILLECVSALGTERVALEEALKRTSYVDSLTGLYNQNRFYQESDKYQNRTPLQLGIAERIFGMV